MAQKTWSYIGRGPIWLRKKNTPNGRRVRLGNASGLNFTAEEETASLPNYQETGGGLANELKRIASLSAEITAYDLSPQNIAIALRGQVSEAEAGSVIAEAHTAYPGSLVKFAAVPDRTVAPVVKTAAAAEATPVAWQANEEYSESDAVVPTVANGHWYICTTAGTSAAEEPETWPVDGATVTSGTAVFTDMGRLVLVAGEDYSLSTTGIIPLAGGDLDDEDGIDIVVAYTKHPAYVIEAMTSSGDEWELLFEGLNEAETDRPVVVELHRVKFSPVSGLTMIQEDTSFGNLPMTISVLADPAIVGAGLSKYMRVTMADAA